jgi:hypothetical protein
MALQPPPSTKVWGQRLGVFLLQPKDFPIFYIVYTTLFGFVKQSFIKGLPARIYFRKFQWQKGRFFAVIGVYGYICDKAAFICCINYCSPIKW